MSESTTSALPINKRTTRKKTPAQQDLLGTTPVPSETKTVKAMTEGFTTLLEKIKQAQAEFEKLQKEISETRELWVKEQKDHNTQFQERSDQEVTERKRQQETYAYETTLKRKKDQDEFDMKKSQWERELNAQKDQLKEEKQELETLRKQVAAFDSEKEKAVKASLLELEKSLTATFDTERKLNSQQVKAEKDLLNLKIQSLSLENSRQSKEIDTLKSNFEEVSRQFKELAVKVIEGRTPTVSPPPKTE